MHTQTQTNFESYRAPGKNQFAEINGLQFAYRVMGHIQPGTVPLFFCNRFRGTMDEWDPNFIEALAKQRQLVIFDYEGVSSSSGKVPTTPEDMGKSTAAFMKSFGFSQVDLLGFSMGGYVVQILALTEPEFVRKCILCGAGCFGGPDVVPPEDVFFETAVKPSWTFEDKMTLFYGDSTDARERALSAEGRIESQLRLGKEPNVPKEAWQNMVAAIQAAASPDNQWFERMREIKQPFLVMNGDRDKCFPIENQMTLFKNIPNCRLAILPMAGHAAHHQFPECCSLMINDFLT